MTGRSKTIASSWLSGAKDLRLNGDRHLNHFLIVCLITGSIMGIWNPYHRQ